jgi:thioredoxin reductase
MPFRPDPKSIAGTNLPVQERTQVLVVGAGPAGLAAALQAASLGRSVILVDENPLSAETMAENVPLHFGGGMTNAVRNRNAMLEAVVESEPVFSEAFEAGIDIRLGTTCWGVYAPGPDVGWLPGPVAGLMDGDRSWMVGAEQIIVAAGRRDMGLAFAGWEKDGVVGITAAVRLAKRYGALRARRAVVLGSSTEALQAALDLRDTGVEIAAVIDHVPSALGSPSLWAELVAGGTQGLFGYVPRKAVGALEAVEAVIVSPWRSDDANSGAAELTISCDTVLLGVGTVPVIELLDAVGCQTVFDGGRGGVVPVLDRTQRTTKTGIFAVGDCAGIWPAKTLDPEIARAEGGRAASQTEQAGAETNAAPTHDLGEYRLRWVRAAVIDAEGAAHVCQCEEVTAREILEVRPPRYLGWEDVPPAGEEDSGRNNRRDLRSLLGDSPPHPDQVKRLTRAGMGVCQGRRCREQVAALLALAADVPLERIPAATHRAPVRPMRLNLAALASTESAAMAEHWDTWFGMPSQYVPYWEVPDTYTAGERDQDAEVASE